MQPGSAHHPARQGTSFSVSTGTCHYPPKVEEVLRKKNAFSKEDLALLGAGPPESLRHGANKHTTIFPCPNMSVEELVASFSNTAYLPTVEVSEKLREQPWIREKGHVSWMRVDPLILSGQERASEGRCGSARELAIICLMLHDPKTPGNWGLWRAMSSTESVSGFKIYVRMLHGNVQFHQAGRGDMSAQQTLRIRTARQ